MEQRPPVRLVTAYRKSKTFDCEYVGRLSMGFHQFHPESAGHEFRVVEDYRWPGFWCKMAALEFIAGQDAPWYFADLDTIIIGRLPLADATTCNHDFYRPGTSIQSGFMYVTPGAARLAITRFKSNPDKAMRECRGDGEFLSKVWKCLEPAQWRHIAPGMVVSYKVHCQDEAPASASVICYHGRPRPRDTQWATGGAKQYAPLAERFKGLPA